MADREQGFTLIELVAVVVILGALAAVALPRFIDLQDEAQEAALDGVRGAAASAHATNLAAALADSDDAQPFNACGNTDKLMQGNLDGYTFDGDITSSGAELGAELDCTVEQTATNNTRTFTGFAVPP